MISSPAPKYFSQTLGLLLLLFAAIPLVAQPNKEPLFCWRIDLNNKNTWLVNIKIERSIPVDENNKLFPEDVIGILTYSQPDKLIIMVPTEVTINPYNDELLTFWIKPKDGKALEGKPVVDNYYYDSEFLFIESIRVKDEPKFIPEELFITADSKKEKLEKSKDGKPTIQVGQPIELPGTPIFSKQGTLTGVLTGKSGNEIKSIDNLQSELLDSELSPWFFSSYAMNKSTPFVNKLRNQTVLAVKRENRRPEIGGGLITHVSSVDFGGGDEHWVYYVLTSYPPGPRPLYEPSIIENNFKVGIYIDNSLIFFPAEYEGSSEELKLIFLKVSVPKKNYSGLDLHPMIADLAFKDDNALTYNSCFGGMKSKLSDYSVYNNEIVLRLPHNGKYPSFGVVTRNNEGEFLDMSSRSIPYTKVPNAMELSEWVNSYTFNDNKKPFSLLEPLSLFDLKSLRDLKKNEMLGEVKYYLSRLHGKPKQFFLNMALVYAVETKNVDIIKYVLSEGAVGNKLIMEKAELIKPKKKVKEPEIEFNKQNQGYLLECKINSSNCVEKQPN